MYRDNHYLIYLIPCFLVILIILFPFLAIQTHGSVVIKVDFEQVAQEAEFIFEGEVISKEVRPSDINGKPFTYFTFKILDVIKGSYPDATIELGYMGGQLGDIELQVSDMRMPEVGERGVYFVETLDEQQVHPLFGWQQGHYRVVRNAQTGEDVVVPIQEETVKGRALMMQQGILLNDFKQNIRDAMGVDK